MKFLNYSLLNAVDGSADQASVAIDCSLILRGGIQSISTTAGAAGAIQLQASNDPIQTNYLSSFTTPVNWVSLSGKSSVVSGISTYLIPSFAVSYQWLRVTFTSSVTQASLVEQDLTYTSVARGVSGNAITIAYITGGVAGSEVVTVTGSAISVSMDATPIIGSTATEILTAIQASVAASALVTVAVTGTGSTVQAAVGATHLASGVDGGLITVKLKTLGF